MDRRSEKRLDSLKQWRRKCAAEVELDPGVLCPNSTLETIALNPPESHEEMLDRPELKQWFARSFGAEIVTHLQASEEG